MDWKSSWLTIFTEAFEGVQEGADGTYFVQGNEAFMPLVRSLSAEQASHDFGGRANSIAAHAHHAAYYTSLLNDTARGIEVNPDWAGSWSVQSVTEPEWDSVRDELERQYSLLRGFVSSGSVPTDQEQLDYAMAQLAHAAFHLGSVRQLAALLDGSTLQR